MKKFICTVALVALSIPTLASASLVQVGDTIGFTNRAGNPGGEFGVKKKTAGVFGSELFVTFCIERNEFLNFLPGSEFVVDSIETVARNGGQGGGNPDPLSGEAAWLYLQFWNGTLAGYNMNTEASANALQHALWRFEDETFDNALSTNYFNLANAASAADKAAALNVVRVVNISWATTGAGGTAGQLAQSVLIVVPEASTMAVWSILSLCGLAVVRLRGNRRR